MDAALGLQLMRVLILGGTQFVGRRVRRPETPAGSRDARATSAGRERRDGSERRNLWGAQCHLREYRAGDLCRSIPPSALAPRGGCADLFRSNQISHQIQIAATPSQCAFGLLKRTHKE